jgi:predicted ATPase/DNA-binding XRE family transcriptional regulator
MSHQATFGHWLRRRRRALGLTQEQLAREIPCAVETIRKLESGTRRPSMALAERLSGCLLLAGDEQAAFVAVALDVVAPAPAGVEAAAPPTNLLAPPTSLVGRDDDLAAICAQLRRPEVRLLTLVGPPGIGKTRLSQEAARHLRENFRHGVFFVALAPLRDPDLVAQSVAQALGMPESGATPPLERLKAVIQGRHLLLVLDNFEHLLDGAGDVAELLAAAPGLKVLATSREVLRLSGEHLFAVPPLAVPRLDDLPPRVEGLTTYSAVQLFEERARAASPSFALNQANMAAVAELCVRLEGLPLAIELAAGRSRLFGPRALLSRLHSQLALLVGGARDLPPRQRTLRAAIAWSYDLLDPVERMLFQRCGVFVGGCTLAALEAVCTTNDDLSLDLLEAVSSLCDKQLLQRHSHTEPDEPRFVPLESIREFMLEQLAASGGSATLRRQHAAYYFALARAAGPNLKGAEQQEWLARLEAEHDNLRAALAWSLEHDPTLGLELAGALAAFWERRGHWIEGRRWLTALLAAGDGAAAARAWALNRASMFAWNQGDYLDAEQLCGQSLELYRRLEDERGMAGAYEGMGASARALRDYGRAEAHFEAGLALYRELDDQEGVGRTLLGLGAIVYRRSDYVRATTMGEQSLELYERLGDQPGMAHALGFLAILAECRGDYRQHAALMERCFALEQQLGDTISMAGSTATFADIALRQGDYSRAEPLYQQALAVFQQAGSKRSVGHIYIDLGNIALAKSELRSARERYERAFSLLQEVSDPLSIAAAHASLGRLAYAHGDAAAAGAHYAESARLYRQVTFLPGLAGALCGLGKAACALGDHVAARAHLVEGLLIWRDVGNSKHVADALEASAALAASTGHAEQAARLLGAAEALRDADGLVLHLPERAEKERTLAAARGQLGEAATASALADGRMLTMTQAIHAGLAVISGAAGA